MTLGELIRIFESIVTVYCGAVLAARPYPMRWKNRAAKVLYGMLIVGIMIFRVANSFYVKFSGMEIAIVSVYLFVVIFIFYKVNVVGLIVRNFVFWLTYKLFYFFIIYIVCFKTNTVFEKYITSSCNIPWNSFHIVFMIVVICSSIGFLAVKNRFTILSIKMKKFDLIGGIIFILCEKVLDKILFNWRYSLNEVDNAYLVLVCFILWTFVSTMIIALVLKDNMVIKHREQVERMRFQMFQNQYALIQASYKEKRHQVHDAVQKDILLQGYLEQGKIEKAKDYLDNKIGNIKTQRLQRYSENEVINLMVNYKLNKAEEYSIQTSAKIDVLSCPVADEDLCVALGNLFDNAIEAAKNVPLDKRYVKVQMTSNVGVLVIIIENSYSGDRKKKNGKYITTKTDKSMHGIGLESIERMTQKYQGYLTIEDDGKSFKVKALFSDITDDDSVD